MFCEDLGLFLLLSMSVYLVQCLSRLLERKYLGVLTIKKYICNGEFEINWRIFIL